MLFVVTLSLTTVYADGEIDTSFVIGTGFTDPNNSFAGAQAVLVQSDGKILVGGDFTEYNGVPVGKVVRLNANGSIDNTFVTGTGFGGTDVQDIKQQSDGKLVFVGAFNSYNGETVNYIIRLNPDGTRDTSFIIGTGFTGGNSTTLAIQPDGKIIIGGYFNSYNGTPANRIVRLNTDGSIDTSFVTGTGFDSSGSTIGVGKIILELDGKILVSGYFEEYNSTPANGIIRLNADGSIDSTFAGGFNGDVLNIELQSDGKIIAVGRFTQYNGTPANRFVRLNVDETIDTSFNVGTSFDGNGAFGVLLSSIAIQEDGKIIIGGTFETYNGTPAGKIIRLNTDGSVDSTFLTGTGFNDYLIYRITPYTDDKIIAVGIFDSYNDTPSKSITRIITSTPEPEPEKPRTRVIGGGGSSRTVVTVPVVPTVTPSTDDSACKIGDKFSVTTGAPCSVSVTVPSISNSFTTSLRQGMTDPEVKLLQMYLNTHGALVAATGAGSPGKETNFFGPATKAAVVKFQLLNNIVPASGFFGPLTRAFVNK